MVWKIGYMLTGCGGLGEPDGCSTERDLHGRGEASDTSALHEARQVWTDCIKDMHADALAVGSTIAR